MLKSPPGLGGFLFGLMGEFENVTGPNDRGGILDGGVI